MTGLLAAVANSHAPGALLCLAAIGAMFWLNSRRESWWEPRPRPERPPRPRPSTPPPAPPTRVVIVRPPSRALDAPRPARRELADRSRRR